MTSQTVILVDRYDNKLGYGSKEEAHRGRGMRHRAFVTALRDYKGQMILQRRKHALFDGYWDLTAISHPLKINNRDETYQEASDRALFKEMRVGHVEVKKIGAFNYFAKDGQNCENEYCMVLLGEYDGEYRPNPAEVYETKKVMYKEFIDDVKANSKIYTPWTVLASKVLERYFK